MHALPLLLVAISLASASPFRRNSRRRAPINVPTFPTTPTFPTVPDFGSQKCSESSRSCTTSTADSCCVAKMGLVILAQQWIPGYGPKNQFTLHGLWPNNCDGTYTNQSCDSQREYNDVKEFIGSSLEAELNMFWPSYKGGNSGFWTNEWNKHGTCVSTLEPRCFSDGGYKSGDEISIYFKKVLELRRKFDLYAALSDAGITPSSSALYDKQKIIDAVKSKYGAVVKLSCRGQTISEVQMAFHVIGKENYEPVDYFMNISKPCPAQISFPPK